MDRFRNSTVPKSVEMIFKKFGEKQGIWFQQKGEGRYKIRGVFSEQYWETGTDGTALNNRKPNVFVTLYDLKKEPVENQDTVVIRGVEYRITAVDPDDAGNMILHLNINDDDNDYLHEFDTSYKEEFR